nr:SusC/RagA family TonB-linked outer membrane protein [Pseudopedobacter sp.]
MYKKYLLIVLYILIVQQLKAQGTLQGKVMDVDQITPLIGATVTVINGNTKTQTNAEGYFSLANYSAGTRLQISFIGYQSLDTVLRKINNEALFYLKAVSSDLQEVVVNSGYQQIKKERLTGAYTQVDQKLLNRVVSANILDRLDGNVSGLVFNRTNQSNDISIRGRSTLFGTAQPLIVIDDFPYEGDISNINPNDVASITILKDAAAASVWGTRAGNGVIVITTKKGSLGQALKVSLNMNATVAQKPDVFYAPRMSTGDFIDIEKSLFNKGFYSTAENSANHEALSPVVELLIKKRDGLLSAAVADAQINALRQLDVRNDISKYLYQDALKQQYYLQLAGGGKAQSFQFSMGYDKEEGALVKNGKERYSFNFGNQLYLLKDRLSIKPQLSFIYSHAQLNNPGEQALSLSSSSSFIYPYAQLMDANGQAATLTHQYRKNFVDNAVPSGLLDWSYQPLNDINANKHDKNNYDYRAGLSTQYTFNPSLAVTLNYQFNLSNGLESNLQIKDSWYTRDQINSFSILNPDGSVTRNIPVGSILDEGEGQLRSHNLRLQANYSHLWAGKHELNALAGTELRDQSNILKNNRQYGYQEESATYQLVDYLSYFPLNYYTGRYSRVLYADGRTELTDRFLSYFANAAYTYAGKYTATLSGRLDRSNLFGVATNQKGVPLGSVGIRWDVQKEKFYHLDPIPRLALRMSFGYNGNIDKTLSAYTTALTIANSFITALPYARVINPPNPSLKWERTKILNWGLDFETKSNRVTGSIDFYLKNGLDLIGDAPLPPSVGLDVFRGNTSNTKGKGIDIDLHSRNLTQQFKWSTDYLMSYATDQVTSYSDESPINNYLLYGSGTGNQNFIYPLVGKPLFAIYSYPWGGLNPQTGAPRGYDSNGNLTENYSAIINGTTSSQLVYHGSARPLYFGSIRNNFSYKQWTLSANIVYRLGYFIRKPSVSYSRLLTGEITHGDYAQRWQQAGDEAITPIPSIPATGSPQRDQFYLFSSALVERGDHIRFQDINLNYQLKTKTQSRIKEASVYLYLSNLGIIWKAGESNYDPDYFYYKPVFQSALGVKFNF